MRNLKEKLGRLVPVLILNPMGLRPAVQRANPAIKGLWLRFRIAFLELEDDGSSENVCWKEVVLEGVMILQQLTAEDEAIEKLKDILEEESNNLDPVLLEQRIDEIELHLMFKITESFSGTKSENQSIAFGKLVTKAEIEVQRQVVEQVITEGKPEVRGHAVQTAIAEATPTEQTRMIKNAITEVTPEVQKQVIQKALTEAEPQVRESVLATLSVADLEAALARLKGSDASKK